MNQTKLCTNATFSSNTIETAKTKTVRFLVPFPDIPMMAVIQKNKYEIFFE